MKTVDKVLSKFTKLVDELGKVAKKNEDKAIDYTDQIDELTARRKTCRQEITRASTVRKNINKLLGE